MILRVFDCKRKTKLHVLNNDDLLFIVSSLSEFVLLKEKDSERNAMLAVMYLASLLHNFKLNKDAKLIIDDFKQSMIEFSKRAHRAFNLTNTKDTDND